MVKFSFVVNDPAGMHARPAGQLVREAAKCSGKITISKGGKTGNAKHIFNVMGLSIKTKEEVEITVEGDNEAEEAAALEAYIRENF